MNDIWFYNIPRTVIILIAAGLYIIALFAVVRRVKKSKYIPSPNSESLFADYNGPERREYPREKLGIWVRYKKHGQVKSIQIFREGRARDISEQGLLLETLEKLTVNDTLEIKLKLPESLHFMLMRGLIVRVSKLNEDKGYRYGINILEIDAEDRKKIAEYVTRRPCETGLNQKEH